VTDGTRARLLEELRPAGFAVAYRMLGSVGEAESIVQEALVRLHHELEDGEPVESPRSFLATAVTRLCVDHLRSAGAARRESYVEALPEPLVRAVGSPGGEPGDPDDPDEVADSLSLAFLVLLESLTARQRAAYLLHEVFDHPYDRIAAILATSEEDARRLVARARRRVGERRPRFEPSRERRERLAQRFFAAAQEGDIGTIDALLAHDATLHGDGGGPVRPPSQPLNGRGRVARTLLAWVRATTRYGGFSLREVEVNGQPGAVLLDPSERPIGVLALEIAEGGQVQTVTSVVNPDKLAHLGGGRRRVRPGRGGSG
jgi:RNA polymerase sigma-70 factor (ECF subfamily)